ncbi:hypothetical protein [Sulfurimonas sp. HSL3-7]|uniref:hypothetical protein n=1 Tax=Sulfonitrofixus jiaomeiensis TaxID=3131938 RepID=UPI0031F92D09
MNDTENYKLLVESIFGQGTCTFDITDNSTNKVIGALNSSNFTPFTSSFTERLKRLNTLYSSHKNFQDLLNTINQVADQKNWEGAYAELVAYDFLNSDTNLMSEPIDLETTVPASDTVAQNLGYQHANFDGKYQDFNIYFDVKILSDKTDQILSGIFKEVQQKLGRTDFLISPEYPLDLDYEVFEQNRKKLLEELLTKLDNQQEPVFIKSMIVSDLKYAIIWRTGMSKTESTYNPYLHAKNHYKLLFKHAKKFSRVNPSLIVFVVFPWFSERALNSNLDSSNEKFYRSFARRFFCDYSSKSTKAQVIYKKYSGQESIFDITKQLSGVLFLEDQSITSSEPKDQNIKAFAYLNPNANHKIGRGFYFDYLNNLEFFIDDFEFDNY